LPPRRQSLVLWPLYPGPCTLAIVPATAKPILARGSER
jgi:hypothetical protein